MSGPFNGRRILVTGAAKGIGLATVARLASEGARVAALDRDAAALASLPARLGERLGHAAAVDVADGAAVAGAVEASAAALGGLDGVVNAAGIDLYADIEAMAPADWARVLAVNLTGPFLVIQAAYPHLKAAGGGTIVNVSSAAGLSPLKNRTAYCGSKAGLQMASKALAMEAAAFKIRVNTVCPGAVETDLFRSGFASAFSSAQNEDAIRESVRARYALNRIAEPEEIAAAIVWLSSPESSYVTGVALAVDGGRSFH
jgi:NAD(P)-dependent dehydrogenase (short-subunit alcohol dehydrogenase family)